MAVTLVQFTTDAACARHMETGEDKGLVSGSCRTGCCRVSEMKHITTHHR